MDVFHELGNLALGSRLKRLSDRFMSEASKIYTSQKVPFEPRWFPLFSLLARRDRLSVGQAADALGISHAAVSQTAQELLHKDLLTSTLDPADKRRVVLSLSAHGKALLPKLNPLWSDIGSAVDEVVRATGVDLLAVLSRLEQTLDAESMYTRTQRRMLDRRSDQIKIVDFKPKDEQLKTAFRQLNEEWITKFFRLEDADRKVLANPKKEIIDRGGHILFALDNDQPIGVVALFNRDRGIFELGKMAVTAKAQGRHVGKKLMQAAIARAREHGAHKIILETNDMLTPAVNMYRRFGFVAVPNASSHAFERVNLIMELKLSDLPSVPSSTISLFQ